MEEEDFIIAEQRHRETLSAMKRLVEVFESFKVDPAPISEIKKEIVSLRATIESFIAALPKAPEGKEYLIVDELKKLKEGIGNIKVDMPERKEEWIFDVFRNARGQIVNIKAKQE